MNKTFKITALFLTSLIIVNVFSLAIVFSVFKINQSYISENLCENKDQPELHCNGRCVLKKAFDRINKIAEEEGQQIQVPLVSFVYTQPASVTIEKTPYVQDEISYVIFNETSLDTFSRGVFHPPQA